MPTTYNIRLMAVHPLNMGFVTPDHASSVMRDLETFCHEHGMVAVGAQVERNDDARELKYESAAWSQNAPDALLVAIADMFDGYYQQLIDPDSPLYNAAVANEYQRDIGARVLADMFIEYRREVKKS